MSNTSATLHSEPIGDLARSSPHPPLLSALRLASMRCRVAPYLAPSLACRLLLPQARAGEFADALARALPALMRRRPSILPPESRSRSFDEDWLLALADATRRRDVGSIRFLLGRRARPGGADALRFLLGGLMERLDIS